MMTSKTTMTAVVGEIVEEVANLSMEMITAIGESAQNAIQNRLIVDQQTSIAHH